jgi:CheY-like chemotaxis protein
MRGVEMNQILMMSNDPILKRKSLEVLVSAGFRVTDVSDALDGLLMVDKDGFSAIVIDEELADIDGYRACQKIRQYSQLPVILLGTESSEDVWAKVDELGFDVYLKKPVSPRELVAQIKSVIRRAHYEEGPKPSQVEKPSELRGTLVAHIQETQPSRLDKVVESERPSRVERPVEAPHVLVPPIQETRSMRMDRTIEPEKPVVKQENPVEVPATRMVATLEETKSIRLGGTATPAAPAQEEIGVSSLSVWTDARMAKLVDALAAGKFTEIHPVIDISAHGGFAYPEVDRLIGTTGDETRFLLESLAKENVLNKNPFEKVHVDPDGSFQMVPVERCPNCGSGNLIKGQLIEHFFCGNVGMEQD